MPLRPLTTESDKSPGNAPCQGCSHHSRIKKGKLYIPLSWVISFNCYVHAICEELMPYALSSQIA